MPERLKLALMGIGKIATDQHIPAIEGSDDWNLAATVSRNASLNGIDAYRDIETMLSSRSDIEVVSLSLPPVPRFDAAMAALRAGRHVMLEKPPGATLAEVHALEAVAKERGITLYATWHSRMAQGVAKAREWLADKKIERAKAIWREDVRKWHPDQDWVFEPGGLGVFDPGINGLSILTAILPIRVHLTSAELDVPRNRQTPIAARLTFSDNVSAEFDWREEDADIWDVEVETDGGQLALRNGGNRLEIDGRVLDDAEGTAGEYSALYARMAELVRSGSSEVDLEPMIHVSDAMTLGRRNSVEPFEF